MDELMNAIAQHLQGAPSSEAQGVFDALTRAYHEASSDWEQFKESLRRFADENGVTHYIEEIERYLENTDRLNSIATMAQHSVNELTDWYQQMVGGEHEGAEQEGQQGGYDEQAWHSFLQENGPRWDGTDNSWGQFRDWFVYEAEQAGLRTPAGQLVEYLESTNDKAAVFAQYGVTIHQQTPEQEQHETEHQEQ